MLAIVGAIVAIDAMGKAGQRFRQAQPGGMARRGCQRDIAQTIVDKKADYVLVLKGNQGSLREDVGLFAAEQKARDFADTKVTRDTTIGGDRGRIETRTATAITMEAVLDRPVAAHDGADQGRDHDQGLRPWPVMPFLKPRDDWVMDMIFRDDDCRARTGHAPANFTIIEHMAHNLPRTATSKDSMRLRRKVAVWDDDFLAGLIAR